MKLYFSILIFILLFIGCSSNNIDSKSIDHFENIYGISSSNYNIRQYEIEDGQNLSDILVEQGIDYLTVDRIAQNSRNIYDARKMRSGNPYFILSSDDTLNIPEIMIYERNPIDFVVFNLSDSLNVYLESKTLTIDTTETSGIIDESLWLTMIENNADPELAIKLSEIYAWTIDFFGIHKNDNYKIVYEKMYADTQFVGIGNIIAVSFDHLNSQYYAFYFEQDSIGDYFDEEGGSLRRAFLKAPLRFSRISSRFSYNRRHPILKIRRPHLGVDYVAPIGTPVHSIGDGVVTKAGRRAQEGRMVQVKHNGTYSTMYLHLSRYGKGIKVGTRVNQGQVLGYVGSSGLSTGAHLDFRFYQNGRPVDPLKVKSPPVKPVRTENVVRYDSTMNYWTKYLDSFDVTIKDTTSHSDTL